MNKIEKIDQELHLKFSEYGKNAREWTRKCVLLLPEIEKREIWKKKGFGSIYEYVAKLAGMSHETVNDSLRVLRKIEDKPELLKIAEQRGINCIKPIVNLVENKEDEKFWAQKVKIMGRHTLEAYAKAIREQDRRTGPSGNGSENLFGNLLGNQIKNELEKVEIKMLVSPKMADKLQKLKGDKEWEELMVQFLKLREEKLEEERREIERREIVKREQEKTQIRSQEQSTEVKGKNEDLFKAKSRYIPAKIKRFVVKKTEGRCAFPGCMKPGKILHHTERFEFNRFHDPAKIVSLCAEHEAIAHLGLIENEEKPEEKWKILRQADRNQLKYIVDLEVGEYRRR